MNSGFILLLLAAFISHGLSAMEMPVEINTQQETKIVEFKIKYADLLKSKKEKLGLAPEAEIDAKSEWKQEFIMVRRAAREVLGKNYEGALYEDSIEIYYFETHNGDGEEFRSYIGTDLSSDGVLTFDVEAGKKAPMRGYELVKKMFAFHENIKKCKGQWYAGTNVEMFLKEFENRSGSTLMEVTSTKSNPRASKKFTKEELETLYKDTAKATWTGKQFALHGFTEIESVEVDSNQGKDHRYDIIAIFIRP